MSSVTRNLSADSLMAFSPVAEPFKKKTRKKIYHFDSFKGAEATWPKILVRNCNTLIFFYSNL